MHRKKPGVDIIKDLLELALVVKPASVFIKSLLFQYEERGGLSKKQLEGLYSIASKIKSIPPNKLATLQAVLLKRPNRYKSPLPEHVPLYQKDDRAAQMIHAILQQYPQHKRVLFFKTKSDNNESLSALEKNELDRFFKFLTANSKAKNNE